MTGAKRKPLVPITREYLRQFYQSWPLEPVPVEERDAHIHRVEELLSVVSKPGTRALEVFGMPTPTRIDDCFWRNRMICEEAAFSLSKLKRALAEWPELVAACQRCEDMLTRSEREVFAVQVRNTSSVKDQMKQFIPQDFRGALLERQRVAGEAKYKKQIDDLVHKGGSIRQKYDLYLQQQWERRQALVQLGEMSGVFKMAVKLLAGIPQVLLDFAKEINAKLGPMEEQRIKYGPDLYGVTTLGLRLDVALAAWAENADDPAARATAAAALAGVVEPAVAFYCQHMVRVVGFIGEVFQHSPFFVSKEDLEGHPPGADGHGGGGEDAAAAGAAAAAARDRLSSSTAAMAAAALAGQNGAGGKPAVPEPPLHAGPLTVAAPAAFGPGGAVQLSASVQEPGTPAPRSGEFLVSDSGARGDSYQRLGPQQHQQSQPQSPAPQQESIGSSGGEAAAAAAVAVAAASAKLAMVSGGQSSSKKLLRVDAAATAIEKPTGVGAGAGKPPRPPLPPLPPSAPPLLMRTSTPPPHDLTPLAVSSPGRAPSHPVWRPSWTGESQLSFVSAEEHQPWHELEEEERAQEGEPPSGRGGSGGGAADGDGGGVGSSGGGHCNGGGDCSGGDDSGDVAGSKSRRSGLLGGLFCCFRPSSATGRSSHKTAAHHQKQQKPHPSSRGASPARHRGDAGAAVQGHGQGHGHGHGHGHGPAGAAHHAEHLRVIAE